MQVRNFTRDQLPALLDFVETSNSWGQRGREMGRQTFKQILEQPGSAPTENCWLVANEDQVYGFCRLTLELPIARAVLELAVASELAASPLEREMIHLAVARAAGAGARVVHLCLSDPAPKADLLSSEGFIEVRKYWDMVWSHDTLPEAELPQGYLVRPFRKGDAAVLARAQNDAFAGSWGFCPNTVEQIEYGSSMANTREEGILFLYHGAEVAGYCWTCLSPVAEDFRGIIGMIGVVPDYRGRGISRHLLLAGIEFLRTQKVADIGLQVDGNNAPAIGLYTSVGFEKTAEHHWFELGFVPAATPNR